MANVRRIAFQALVLGLAKLSVHSASATTYDLSLDFSATANPNGVWTYGAKSNLAGAVVPFGIRGTTPLGGVPIQYWQLVPAQEPTIYRNGTSSTASSGGQLTIPPGTVWMFGGINTSPFAYGAVRFTVPVGGEGEYSVESAVSRVYDGSIQGDTDFHVVKNGAELFGVFLAPADHSGYSNILSLVAGDTVDFLVGRGADNNNYASGLKTRIAIRRVATPPPPTPSDYVLSRDFSPTNNPSGAWSYGAKSNLNGAFSTFGVRGLNPFEYWQLVPSQEPTIYRNGTSDTITIAGGSGVFPPGTTFLYSGTDGAANGFGAVRFTVPSGGSSNYLVEAEVRPVYDGGPQGDTDFHVVKNGAELFGRFLATSDRGGYTNTLALVAGDVVDFMVGRGQDNSGTGSGLKINVALTPTSTSPPPATGLVANGSFELGVDPGISSDVSAPNSTTITGWTVETASVDYIGSRWTAGDGVRCMDLSGTDAGTISQMISGLTPGQSYRLSFLMAANPEVGAITARLRASIGGASQEYSFVQSGFTTANLGWTEKTLDFTASSASHTLSFASLNPGWAGAALDEIAITAAANPPSAGEISIVNHSFENPVVPDGQYNINDTPGWVGVGTWFHVANPADDWFPGTSQNSSGPNPIDGLNIAGFNIPTRLYQDLGAVLLPNHTYTLSLLMGTRKYVPFGTPKVRLIVGGVTVAEKSPAAPPEGTFNRCSLTYVSPSSGEVIGAPVRIEFQCFGVDAQVWIDDVHLTAEPNGIVTNPPPVLAEYSLGRDFSSTSNPNGAWSFGWTETLDGPFTLLGFHKTIASDNGVAISDWQVSDGELPGVAKVVGAGTAVSAGGAFTAPSGTVYSTPGNDGTTRNFSVIRFTVPAGGGGEYRVESAVQTVFDGPLSGDSDFHVTRNGQELFGEFLPPNTPSGYTNDVTLSDGDTVDFVVGRGTDGSQAGTALKIQAMVTKTSTLPTPPSGLIFDLSEGVSTNSNPNGSWSYGWASTVGGNLGALTGPHTGNFDGGAKGYYWALSASQYPAVYKNISSNTITAGGAAYAPGTVWFIPGENGRPENFGVIRFTVPTGAAGTYILGADVAPAYTGGPQGDSDFHIAKNGVELFGRFLAPTDRASYTNVLTVGDGDTIDFAIGRGADGNLYGSILRIAASLTATTNTLPPWIIVQPQSRQVIKGNNVSLSVVAVGSSPLQYQWRKGDIDLVDATNSTLALTGVRFSDAGPYSVVVSNDLGSITSQVASVVVNLGPSILRVISVAASSEGQVELPVELVANGNENAIGFSLSFNPALLTFTQVTPGETAIDASLIVNTNELANGRLGIALALPAETVFPEGIQQLVRISFDAVSATQSASTQIGFADQPVLRQVSDVHAVTLEATYSGGSVSIEVTGLEADVAPRLGGNNSVTIIDWVQLGRYVAALDSITNSLEFQRADCAPRTGRGNGVISVSDWVQAGRYAAGLDPIRPAGGPREPSIPLAAAGAGIQAASGRVLMIPATNALPGSVLALPVWLASAGNENALAFTLSFDAASFQFIGATKLDKMSAATLNVNTNLGATGKVGFAMALPTGAAMPAGLDPILLLNFAVATSATGIGSLSFGDSPVFREVADVGANPLSSLFTGASVTFGPPREVGPPLTAVRSGNSLLFFWPSSAQGFEVYSAGSVNAANWVKIAGSPVAIGGQWLMTAPLTGGHQYFRLEKR